MSSNESIRESSPNKPTISNQDIPTHAEGRHSPTRPKPLPFDDGTSVDEISRSPDTQQKPPMDNL